MSENLLLTLVNAIIGNNLVLGFLLGTCPLILYQLNIKTSLMTGILISIIMLISTILVQMLYYLLLVTAGFAYLKIVSVILITYLVMYVTRTITRRYKLSIAELFDIYPEFFYTNYAIYGLIFLNIGPKPAYLHTAISALGSAAGYVLIMIVFYAIKERNKDNKHLSPAQQIVIQLTALGLLGIVFMSISGLR